MRPALDRCVRAARRPGRGTERTASGHELPETDTAGPGAVHRPMLCSRSRRFFSGSR